MQNAFTNNELIQRLVKMSTASFESDNRIMSCFYARQAHLIEPKDNMVLHNYIVSQFNLKLYPSTISSIDKIFASNPYSKYSPKIVPQLLFLKGKSLLHTRRFEEAKKVLQEAYKLFIEVDETARADEVDSIISTHLTKKMTIPPKTNEEKSKECEFVYNFMESYKKNLEAGQYVYLLPKSWFDRWKAYNNFQSFLSSKNDLMNIESDSQLQVSSEDSYPPGAIDPFELLETEQNFVLIDTDHNELPMNLQLRQDLVKDKDFIPVSLECYQYLSKLYSGVPLARLAYRPPETEHTNVELWLQKINVIILPYPKDKQPPILKARDVIYMSRFRRVVELIEKLTRIYSGFIGSPKILKAASRIWKVSGEVDLTALWKKWDGSPPFEIPGEIVSEEASIKDLKLEDEDLLIIEFNCFGNDWILDTSIYENVLKKKKHESRYKPLASMEKNQFSSNSMQGLAGLANMGNTCFLNSAIQCLSNTLELTSYFLTDEYEKDINQYNPLGAGGKLALVYAYLMKDLWQGTKRIVTPWDLKKIISKIAPQFSGTNQQDTQEFLSYILDGLHEDLNKVKIKPNVETKDYDGRKDEIVAQESWENHLKRNQSRIQELMHGQYKSTLSCQTCGNLVITFEPFNMVSIPITFEDCIMVHVGFAFSDANKPPLKISMSVLVDNTLADIIKMIAEITGVLEIYITLATLKDLKLKDIPKLNTTLSAIKEAQVSLFGYEIRDKEPNLMDMESDPSGLLKVHMISESRSFFDSEKPCAFTRLIGVKYSETFRDISFKIYLKLRRYIANYFEIKKMLHPIVIKEDSLKQLELEFNELFGDPNSKGCQLYSLYIKDEVTNKSKQIDITFAKLSFGKYLDLNGFKFDDVSIELKIPKSVDLDIFQLNYVKESSVELPSSPSKKKNFNIYDGFNLFTRKEVIDKDGGWYCSKCKEHMPATKKMEIYKVPDILTVHFKRFQSSRSKHFGPFEYGGGSKKITTMVDFPIKGLDMKKFVLKDQANCIYDLYSVIYHDGNLGRGHYIANAKNFYDQKWYEYNDQEVNEIYEKSVVSSTAYVLFYRRRNNSNQ